MDLNAVTPKPFRWILDFTWLNLVELTKLKVFSSILTKVKTLDNMKFEKHVDISIDITVNCSFTYDCIANFIFFLSQYLHVGSQIKNSEREWRVWYEKEKPEEDDIPCGYHKSLDVFRKLLLIRSWSPDRTLSQVRR